MKVGTRNVLVNTSRSGLRIMYNAIYMLGILFGSYIFGWLDEVFHVGRSHSLRIFRVTYT